MSENTIYISVADDFSTTPGARFPEDGPFSAEEFRKDYVEPAFEQACSEKKKLIIDLDGVKGYATSFLQGTFGNLASKYGSVKVFENVKIISEDDPFVKDYVEQYIKEAEPVTRDNTTI